MVKKKKKNEKVNQSGGTLFFNSSETISIQIFSINIYFLYQEF